MRFSNLSIASKVLVGIVVLGVVGMIGLGSMGATGFNTVLKFDEFRKGNGSGTISLSRTRTYVALRSRLTLQALNEADASARAKIQADMDTNDARFLEFYTAAEKALSSYGSDVASVKSDYESLNEMAADLLKRQAAGDSISDAGFKRDVSQYLRAAERLDGKIFGITNAAIKEEERRFEAINDAADTNLLIVSAITAVLSLTVAVVIYLAMRRSVGDPLAELVETAKALLGGALDRDVPELDRDDEIGGLAKAIEQLKVSLRASGTLKKQTMDAAQQVATATDQAAIAIEQVSDGVHRQMQSVGSITGALGETTNLIGSIAGMTTAAKESAQSAASMVMSSMESIQALTVAVRDIAVTSEQINRITASIGQLATRSNILSLNAAIEAARAGDHGRGFSVVAEEVGNLAQQTGNLAQEISTLAANTGERIRNGVGIAESVGNIMQDVVVAVGRTDELAADIARSVDEQRRMLAAIEDSLRALQEVSSANAAAGEEISATMVELTRMANRSREQADKVGTVVLG